MISLFEKKRSAVSDGNFRLQIYDLSCQLPVAGCQLVIADSRQPTADSPDLKSQIINHKSHRRALTLIELLVVIVIITALTAIVVPRITPTVESRRIREAVRGLSAYVSGARGRAIATGRPAGVWIERMPDEPGAAMTLYYAEVPPPFSGWTTSSVVEVNATSAMLSSEERIYSLRFLTDLLATSVDPIPEKFLRPRDQIRFNYQGATFVFLSRQDVQSLSLSSPLDMLNQEDTDGYFQTESRFLVYLEGNVLPPWSNIGQRVPYQIVRQPVRSAAPPYQLPAGTAIDLFASGMGDDFFHQPFLPFDPPNNNDDPILIMFSPDGGLSHLIHNAGQSGDPLHNERCQHNVSLLVGKREKVTDTPDPPTSGGPSPPPDNPYDTTKNNASSDELIEKFNWKDPDCRWVSISPQTGQVGTSENASVRDDLSALYPSLTQNERVLQAIRDARRFAQEMHSLGGR